MPDIDYIDLVCTAPDIPDAVRDVKAADAADNGGVDGAYDLSGRKVLSSTPIIIKEGKKIVRAHQ